MEIHFDVTKNGTTRCFIELYLLAAACRPGNGACNKVYRNAYSKSVPFISSSRSQVLSFQMQSKIDAPLPNFSFESFPVKCLSWPIFGFTVDVP